MVVQMVMIIVIRKENMIQRLARQHNIIKSIVLGSLTREGDGRVISSVRENVKYDTLAHLILSVSVLKFGVQFECSGCLSFQLVFSFVI